MAKVDLTEDEVYSQLRSVSNSKENGIYDALRSADIPWDFSSPLLINKSEAERPFVFQVQELVVFGPLVDTDAPTVHGVDILATTARHHRYQNRDEAFHSDSEDFINKYAPFSICSWRFREEFPEKDMLNYLKGRHMGIVTMYGQQDRALLDDGGFFTIIRDGRVQADQLDALKELFRGQA